ncbi:leucine-rich repeat-containing protein 25 isoform X1 [Bufo gargarizans]|uniref:leucine-rich repeat-containing protein 25 isoform X1 n=1 Tax=Bufo gargarizans TaxID=30331 RepID=UPI001CF38912|nr:leucine-rich repeat-containing protein 25 isoform X1 [Bufo gargarizans]XP_044140818.1 leucine-rich repeat-containing protein 25 isoform X1 [Bufo gargarizans]
MWTVMILMTFLHTPAYTIAESNTCYTLNGTILIWSKFNNCSNVILRHKSITAIETSQESRYDKLMKFDISDNNLKRLPEDFLFNSVCLEEVHLGNNSLESLPEMFLINSSRLKTLSLEGNPLREVPASVFHVTLVTLTIDCKCELVSNISMHLNGNVTKYPKLSATCQMSSEWMNLKDFYEENCGKQYLALYIVLPILAIGLIIGGVALYIWKWKRSSTSLENKGAPDKSPAHVQQRYTSRNTEGIETTLSPHQRQDYENVFVDHLRATETKSHGFMGNEHKPSTHSSKHTAEEDVYLESEINDGDQPIYTNTQGIYYNYTEPSFMEGMNKEEDDVYILPDQ